MLGGPTPDMESAKLEKLSSVSHVLPPQKAISQPPPAFFLRGPPVPLYLD